MTDFPLTSHTSHTYENSELWRNVKSSHRTVTFDQHSDGYARIKSEDLHKLLVKAGFQFSGLIPRSALDSCRIQ